MPHRLVKGLPPLASQGTKIAPLARDSAIGSTMPIKNMTFQSFKSAKVPESMPFGFLPNAKNVLYNEAGYNLSSTFKGKSGPILIHGRRNFSSCPPGTKNIRKMDAGNKGSSRPGTEKISGVKRRL
ncbi:uncharacterized protein [Miscanthus floridulus]|uniref:uncharacterized protein isoform X1 n=1 Tax=Miscanthus floridulus TaxID=154761 RepID=UPI00345A678D